MGLLLAYFYEADQDAGRYAYYGVMGLRHRGYSIEYAVLDGGALESGSVDPWSSSWSLPSGYAVIAAVRPAAILAIERIDGSAAAVACDGLCPCRRIARILAGARDLGEAIEELRSLLRGPCSIAGLRSDGGYVLARGLVGVRPLTLGGYGFEALYAATESAPITLMGGEARHDLEPGEIVAGSRYYMERAYAGRGVRATSVFEYIYMARPDSLVDGVNVYEFRREMGRRLARVHDAGVDVVVGVPETALPYSLGYAEEKGARLELAFVSTLGRVRTAVSGLDLEDRLMTLSLKLNPVPGVLAGRSIAIIDDSVVTGLTLKTVIQRLRRTHAVDRVHVAVTSPKILSRCPYGVHYSREEALIARHLSDEEIARVLDADSLAWLPIEEVLDYLRARGIDSCRECMSLQRGGSG